MQSDRREIMEEIRKWEAELEAATDSGLARWIAFHISLLKKRLEKVEEK